jgi:LmbE family N-acetylglucosaminyl deacetylase
MTGVRLWLAIAGAALLALWPAAGSASAAVDCAAGSSVYVVAHEDDSILFQNPALRQEIDAGRCIETIFVTAGDDGLGSPYWQGREQGAEASYAEMADVPNTWALGDAGVPGHPTPVATLVGKPSISLVFMRLPDGNIDGSGFASNGFQSLQELWQGTISTIDAVDGSSTYTKRDLIDTLSALIEEANADRIVTQDFVGAYGDHSDHHSTAYFTQAAAGETSTAHTLIGYLGYPISGLPANLSAAETQAKETTWFAYAPFDSRACQTVSSCQADGTASWWSREYVSATVPAPSVSGLSPVSGPVGSSVSVDVSGFAAFAGVSVSVGGVAAVVSGGATTDGSGASSVMFTVPQVAAGVWVVVVSDGSSSVASPTEFTVSASGGSVNVAPQAVVTASSESVATGQLAVKAVDGSAEGYPGDYSREWATLGEGAGAWLRLVWSSPQTLTSVTLFDRPNLDDQVRGATITFGDGSSVSVGVLPNDGSPLAVTFAARTVTSLVLSIDAVAGTTQNIGLAEIQAFAG